MNEAPIRFLSVSPGVWGAERSLLTLAESLHAAGHRVSLYCVSAELGEAWRGRVNAAVVVVASAESGGVSGRLRQLVRFFRARGVLPKTGTVVSFSPRLNAPVAVLSLFDRVRRAPRRWFIDLHDYLDAGKGLVALDAAVIAGAGVVAVSEFAASVSRAVSARATVLYRPIVPRSAPLTEPPRSERMVLRIGIVGRIDPDKNHVLLADAIANSGLPCDLVVRGVPTEYGHPSGDLVLDAMRRAVGDQLKYEGPVANELAMDGLDVLVVANEREPLGRTVLEAQLAGLPVVVPDKGGAAELVVDGVTGLYFIANSSVSLGAVLSALAHSADLRAALAIAGRASATFQSDPIRYAHAYASALGRG